MYKIIALMGEAGAGKDTMMQYVLKVRPDLHEIISCTSRPIREGEAEGVNYFYYTPDQFMEKIYDGEMLEFTNFNNWWYGTSYDSVRSDGVINIGVFNPEGVRSLLERDDCDVTVYWVRTDDKKRLLRQLNREEHPDVREIVRRFAADYKDFENIEFDYIELENNAVLDLEYGTQAIVSALEPPTALGQN